MKTTTIWASTRRRRRCLKSACWWLPAASSLVYVRIAYITVPVRANACTSTCTVLYVLTACSRGTALYKYHQYRTYYCTLAHNLTSPPAALAGEPHKHVMVHVQVLVQLVVLTMSTCTCTPLFEYVLRGVPGVVVSTRTVLLPAQNASAA
jgi:hypothetical protein